MCKSGVRVKSCSLNIFMTFRVSYAAFSFEVYKFIPVYIRTGIFAPFEKEINISPSSRRLNMSAKLFLAHAESDTSCLFKTKFLNLTRFITFLASGISTIVYKKKGLGIRESFFSKTPIKLPVAEG